MSSFIGASWGRLVDTEQGQGNREGAAALGELGLFTCLQNEKTRQPRSGIFLISLPKSWLGLVGAATTAPPVGRSLTARSISFSMEGINIGHPAKGKHEKQHKLERPAVGASTSSQVVRVYLKTKTFSLLSFFSVSPYSPNCDKLPKPERKKKHI